MSGSLQVSRAGRVLRIALNRPEKRNALNVQLCRELVEALETADADASAGAILLSGNGKSFCAGMDLNEVLDPQLQQAIGEVQERLFTIGARLTKPLLAAVHGAALAGGAGLTANAHVVLAAEDATFGLTEIRIGLWPFLIFRSVARAVGERRAVEWGLTGRIFGAAEAAHAGLVQEVVPAGELEARAGALAAEMAARSAAAVALGLRYVRQARGLSGEESGTLAARLRDEVFGTEEFRRGVEEFRHRKQ